ncbi:hypothetical protein SteCoe_12295 [Stentor coeruleus]|uniref:Uncharacterized protein n=1 Tax=Stentor coeruleus TaxID=5963 RepID=A0A1R2CB52_9CILI|nr:hypothetical protein SteCoe_12295 [Stentor coeruleus]
MSYYTLASNYPPACRIPHLENNFYIYGENPPIINYPEVPRYLEFQRSKSTNHFSNTQEVIPCYNRQSIYPNDNFSHTETRGFNHNNREHYLNRELQKTYQRQDLENPENLRWRGNDLRLKDLENEEISQRFPQYNPYKQEKIEIPQYNPYKQEKNEIPQYNPYKQEKIEIPQYNPYKQEKNDMPQYEIYDQYGNLRTYRSLARENFSKSNSDFVRSETMPRSVLQSGSSRDFHQNEKPNLDYPQEKLQGNRHLSDDYRNYTGDFGKSTPNEVLKTSDQYTSELGYTEMENYGNEKIKESRPSITSKSISNFKPKENGFNENFDDEKGNEAMSLGKVKTSIKTKEECDDKSNSEGISMEISARSSTSSKKNENLPIEKPPVKYQYKIIQENNSNPQISNKISPQLSDENYSHHSKDALRIPGKVACDEINNQKDHEIAEERNSQKIPKNVNETGVTNLPKKSKDKKYLKKTSIKKTQKKHDKKPNHLKVGSNKLNENIGDNKRDERLVSNASSRSKSPGLPHYLKSTFSSEVKSIDYKIYTYNQDS